MKKRKNKNRKAERTKKQTHNDGEMTQDVKMSIQTELKRKI